MSEKLVGVGIIGSQFEADIHAASICHGEAERRWRWPRPRRGTPRAGRNYGIPRSLYGLPRDAQERDIEMVTIAAPNNLHAEMTVDAANAGKHVVCEKPLRHDPRRGRPDDRGVPIARACC